LNKAAIKSTLNDIPENSKVIISAEDTVYIAHDILDLIESLKTRAVDENITVKLKGFKKAYYIDNSQRLLIMFPLSIIMMLPKE
jgi:hypothetical protein